MAQQAVRRFTHVLLRSRRHLTSVAGLLDRRYREHCAATSASSSAASTAQAPGVASSAPRRSAGSGAAQPGHLFRTSRSTGGYSSSRLSKPKVVGAALDGVLSNTSSVALSCSSGLDLSPQDAAAYPELTALPRSVCVFQRCAVCMLWVCGGGTERLVLSLAQVLNQMVQDVLAFNEAAVTFLPFLDLQSTIPPWSTAFILYVHLVV